MKKYEKPVVMINEELAEGVYANSGDCWSIETTSVQPWSGKGHIFKVHLVHPKGLQHISASTTVTLTFNYPVVAASAQEYTCSVSGNTVTIFRDKMGNAYGEGDDVTYDVEITAADETTTKALAVTAKSVYCEKTTNVQGGGSNE